MIHEFVIQEVTIYLYVVTIQFRRPEFKNDIKIESKPLSHFIEGFAGLLRCVHSYLQL